MTDLKNGRQTVITDEQLLEDTDFICRVLRARQMWSPDYADDLFQEVYLALHKARDKYNPDKGKWIHYAFDKAKYAVKDFFRSPQLIAVDWHWSEGAIHSDTLDDPERPLAVGVSYIGTPLSWELERFTEKERRIIVLKLAGYSNVEIASYLGIGESYIYQLLGNFRIKNSEYYSLSLMGTQQKKRAA